MGKLYCIGNLNILLGLHQYKKGDIYSTEGGRFWAPSRSSGGHPILPVTTIKLHAAIKIQNVQQTIRPVQVWIGSKWTVPVDCHRNHGRVT